LRWGFNVRRGAESDADRTRALEPGDEVLPTAYDDTRDNMRKTTLLHDIDRMLIQRTQ
jgi:hypothetical protein